MASQGSSALEARLGREGEEERPQILYLCKNLFLAFIRHVYHNLQDINNVGNHKVNEGGRKDDQLCHDMKFRDIVVCIFYTLHSDDDLYY